MTPEKLYKTANAILTAIADEKTADAVRRDPLYWTACGRADLEAVAELLADAAAGLDKAAGRGNAGGGKGGATKRSTASRFLSDCVGGGDNMRVYNSAEDVKKAVKAALKAEGLTVAALGERLGLPQGNTSRLINRINPSFNAMRDLAATIGYKLVFDIVPEEKEGEEDGEA